MTAARCAGVPAAVVLLALAPAAGGQTLDGSRRDELADEIAARLRNQRDLFQSRRGSALDLMGYSVVPDGSTNAVSISRGSVSPTGSSQLLTLSQLGFGFTVSEATPLFLEAYLGTARYDPRAVLTAGESTRPGPLRWNNIAMTLGIGYDFPVAENWWLRPIINGSAGYIASDTSLFGSFINLRRDVDLAALTDRHANVAGFGGSLVLAHYDYRPERDIDLELRFTNIHLETVGDTWRPLRGSSDARTLGLWTRYRWPTGWEAFGRPVRWVADLSGSYYLGDQRDALGFAWSVKAGGGLEIDVGRYEVGLAGINLTRLRLIARYFLGDKNVTGTSIGIGMSF